MILISRIEIATTSSTMQAPTNGQIAITRVPTTSMLMAPGPKFPTTGRFGFLESTPIGLPIGPASGFGSPIMVGLGFPLNPGAGRHITMAAGSIGKDHGHGGLVRSIPLTGRFGPPHTSPSLDLAAA